MKNQLKGASAPDFNDSQYTSELIASQLIQIRMYNGIAIGALATIVVLAFVFGGWKIGAGMAVCCAATTSKKFVIGALGASLIGVLSGVTIILGDIELTKALAMLSFLFFVIFCTMLGQRQARMNIIRYRETLTET